MPSASFPIIINVMTEPHVLDAAMGAGDPFDSVRLSCHAETL